jgi:RNA polymerase subunit RPABC4/transcription elongation factor Spt4
MGEKAYGCYRCKEPTDVGVIICPKCADELGKLLNPKGEVEKP